MNRKTISFQNQNSNLSASFISSNTTLLKSTRTHKILYDSIKLLFDKHPPPKELKTCWKEGMFSKVNWEGSNQLIRYMLIVHYGKTEIDKKIPSYLLHSRKNEAAFRKEALDLINNMCAKYPDAQIPKLKTFDLLNPGGERFVILMIRLSTFLMKLVLDSEPSEGMPYLGFIHPSSNAQFNERVLKQTSLCTREHLLHGRNVSDDYELKRQRYKIEADHIASELEQTLERCRPLEAELQELTQRSVTEDEDELDDSELAAIEKLKHFAKYFEELTISAKTISSGNNVLSSDEPLNLLQRCEDLKHACQNQMQQMNNLFTEIDEDILDINSETLKSLNLQQQETLDTIRKTQNEIAKTLEDVKNDLNISSLQTPSKKNDEDLFKIDFRF